MAVAVLLNFFFVQSCLNIIFVLVYDIGNRVSLVAKSATSTSRPRRVSKSLLRRCRVCILCRVRYCI